MATKAQPAALRVDPAARFDLSPYLYMQFMEPLGSTDGSVEAGWDFLRNGWREDLLAATRSLAPPLIRWPGGCLSSYYRWREGVGPRTRRRPMLNLCWGGTETNQIGTHEFVDFCRQVGAEPLIAVNFESDGRANWARLPDGRLRAAGPAEAAAWVAYCNAPTHARRRAHGAAGPFGVRLWQIGNETSYDRRGFDCRTAARRTVAFAKAMRRADPSIQLIGWGDSGWAAEMLDVAGEHLQYLAFHHHFGSSLPDSPLRGGPWRRDPAETWKHLMSAVRSTEARIAEMRRATAGSGVPLALTESHFALPGRNRCEVLSTWAAGVADARILNAHARNGDVLKIATLADFCGTRWQVNAVMIPTPRGAGNAYLMPVAGVMRLFRRHTGTQAVGVAAAPASLDVAASRTRGRIYLHVVNTSRTRPATVRLAVDGRSIRSGEVFQIAADPLLEITAETADALVPSRRRLPADRVWRFPPASVSAVELSLGRAGPRRRAPRGTSA